MPDAITVAAIQMEIVPLEVEKNLKKAEELLLELLAKHQPQLVVFPEDCITGPIPQNLEYALLPSDPAIQHFQQLARQHQLHIVCGSFIQKVGEQHYNTSLLIDDTGEIILEYHKNHPWTTERSYITPGNDAPVVHTKLGVIGLMICWDLAFPEVARQLTKQGADIICCPSYWAVEDAGKLLEKYPGSNPEAVMVDTLCPARAIENQALVIFANGAGDAALYLNDKLVADTQLGHSQICTPVQGTVTKLEHNREGFVVYSYDPQLAADAEANYLIRQDIQ